MSYNSEDKSWLERWGFGLLVITILLGSTIAYQYEQYQKTQQETPGRFPYTSRDISVYCNYCGGDIGGAVLKMVILYILFIIAIILNLKFTDEVKGMADGINLTDNKTQANL